MRVVAVIALLLPVLASVPAPAQSPASAHAAPLRIIVPVGPGGSSDVVARAVGERLAVTLARPVVVENRPGATGNIAVDALRSGAPAATVLIAPVALPVTAPIAFPRSAAGLQDLVPVTQLATFDYAIAVGPDHPSRTFAEFAAQARAHPATNHYAGVGTGSIPHFLGLMIARAARYDTAFVPYADIGKLETDLVGGHVASAVAATSDIAALHRAGRIRILATSGRERAALLPGVPTLRELGYPSLEVMGWNAIFASARLPAPAVEQLAQAANEALRSPAVMARLREVGLEPTGTTPGRLAAIIASDIERWTPIIHGAGFPATP